MDADFRELVYHAGKAMDAAGIEWTIVSGFRDDWRQSIASGIKARTGYSRHGGSVAVGGYGHGRAIDIGHVDRERSDEVWRWIDNNGAKYGAASSASQFRSAACRAARRVAPARVEPAPRAHRRHGRRRGRNARAGRGRASRREAEGPQRTGRECARQPLGAQRPAAATDLRRFNAPPLACGCLTVLNFSWLQCSSEILPEETSHA